LPTFRYKKNNGKSKVEQEKEESQQQGPSNVMPEIAGAHITPTSKCKNVQCYLHKNRPTRNELFKQIHVRLLASLIAVIIVVIIIIIIIITIIIIIIIHYKRNHTLEAKVKVVAALIKYEV
jgi:hypothetical protein